MKKVSVLIIFLIFLTLCIYSDNITDKKLDDVFTKYKIHSGCIIFLDGTKEYLYLKGNDKTVVTENSIFRIASLSKFFISLGINHLIEKNKIDNNTKINEILRFEVSEDDFFNQIKIIDLLDHISGLIEVNGAYTAFLHQSLEKKLPIEEYIIPGGKLYNSHIWNKNSFLNKQFHYSNLGYTILALIIEKISNKNFYDYINEDVFHNTEFSGNFNINKIKSNDFINCFENISGSHVRILTLNDDRDKIFDYKSGINPVVFSPHGGLKCSINDLKNVMKGILRGKSEILSNNTLNNMEKIYWRGSGMNGFFKKQGRGVHIIDNVLENRSMYGYSGESFGVTTNFYYSRPDNKGIIVIANGGIKSYGTKGFYSYEQHIFDIFKGFINSGEK